ncbi:MAG: segregation/condensation protein A [Thermomicrobiales bacterium]|nr:segregation/condensation protein A [Thermomicrobiales bacterium]
MSAIALDNRTAFTYQLRLPTFEGPLDLLLRLIDREQLPITDISLVMVTDQFLEATRGIGVERPESVAEFAAVGARLVALKARSLLPRPDEDDEDAEPSDLVVQLIEYRTIKAAAQEFAAWDKLGLNAFAKGQQAVDLPGKPQELPLALHEPRQLARAISRRLVSNRAVTRLVAVRPMIPLRTMIDRLLDVMDNRRLVFQRVADDACADDHETRALFLALLVLARRNVVEAEQDEPFGPISIQRIPGAHYDMSLNPEEM